MKQKDIKLHNLKSFVGFVKKHRSGCWIWQGAKSTNNKHGYGLISCAGSATKAHIFSWVLFNGDLPAYRGKHKVFKNALVLHRCDVPLCVNPQHLFLGNQADNMQDARNKNRLVIQKGTSVNTAKLQESDVKEIRANFANGTYTNYAAVGREYGISDTAVIAIHRRRSWKHIS